MSLIVKICGLKTLESLDTALDAGADMIGFVFHPKSPRNIAPEQATKLAPAARNRAKIVALVVDPEDSQLSMLRSIVAPDLWQFHGKESFERVREARTILGIPVMKALGVAETSDLAAVSAYARVADHVLLDAKPPKDAAYPGGHGKVFDWNILSALPPAMPFMLSGGLSPENVAEAIRTIRRMGLTLSGVDVSSGVESAPGVKDLGKIRAFIAAAREAG
ncbi:MAG: phosphoribosylanthranilate isomerase [Rhizobiales bacterium PAR1]|nr:MAG: phosphoribosylanthranilate isomerase [Rhizobiales bacterium PAR1]